MELAGKTALITTFARRAEGWPGFVGGTAALPPLWKKAGRRLHGARGKRDSLSMLPRELGRR